MGPTTDLLIRFGAPGDRDALRAYERAYFPAIPGERHSGYLFEDDELSAFVLDEDLAPLRRSFTIVAEVAGEITGFAAAVPSRFPGAGGIDPMSMLLQYVVVDPAHRRRGIGATLLEEIERRSLAARQNVIIAHIPTSQAAFYRANDWDVFDEEHGYAWLPFMGHIRGDVADPGLGFPLMAAKVLRRRTIRAAFGFPIETGRPMVDAVGELARMVDAGKIDRQDLDLETREFLEMYRRQR